MIHRTAGEGGGHLSMTCLISLVSVMIYIFNCEEVIYGYLFIAPLISEYAHYYGSPPKVPDTFS